MEAPRYLPSGFPPLLNELPKLTSQGNGSTFGRLGTGRFRANRLTIKGKVDQIDILLYVLATGQK
jgi:hypothetical protein